jgi:hypothetical protein
MPFKSKAQMKACYAQNNPKWDCKKWSKETKSLQSLPKRLIEEEVTVIQEITEEEVVEEGLKS